MGNVKNDFSDFYATLLRKEARNLLEPLLEQAAGIEDWMAHVEVQLKIAEQFAHLEEYLALLGRAQTENGLAARPAV